MLSRFLPGLLIAQAIFVGSSITAQSDATAAVTPEIDAALRWREVGPFRGGRSCAVAGLASDRQTYYFGAAGGGVWKTRDAGRSWQNVSDGFFGGSIGSVAVSEWDPNVVYVGTGEKTVRGNVSHGDGMWKSTDAGRTWQHSGLGDSRHICRVRIHPKNPDLVYAAALGHLFGPNEERGVYRSKDGGETWERVLFVSPEAGCVDLAMDPTNARVLYASFWRVRRQPWTLESGGEGSSIWKSTDGGDTWTDITRNDGLPDGTIGISGVSVSASNPDNVYAIIEAEDGGLFRSRDAGETWRRVNQERALRQRAWYYTRVVADPVDEEVCYVLNVRFWRSEDGGRNFDSISVPHGDNHDLWIDPADPMRMIQSNDGGANVSEDGGVTWTPQNTQPTAQMYRVSLDDDYPYRLLGGQQDNSAVRIRSRSLRGASIGTSDWESTAGGESGHIVAQPGNPDLVFGGSYGGFLTWVNHDNGLRRSVHAWPDSVMGWGAAELKYRFQWNFPIFFSPHDPTELYIAAQMLFRSRDFGQSWSVISPDLTRDDKSKQQKSGGPITKDDTSVEYYCTIFAACESPVERGVLWCGSDDGLVNVSRDGGKSWQNVTPPGMPEWAQVNSIDPDPRSGGGLVVAATRYKLDDFKPYLFHTNDYGKTWTDITGQGIAEDHFTRVVRFDPEVEGLLYAGTERGVYMTSEPGGHWQSLTGGEDHELPIVPVTDLAVRGEELVAATQGRGYWILNGLNVLRSSVRGIDESQASEGVVLFAPNATVRDGMRSTSRPGNAGANPDAGVVFDYWIGESVGEKPGVSLKVMDSAGELVREFSTDADEGPKPSRDAGMNRFAWNMRLADARSFDGLVMWNRSLSGPLVPPGSYTAMLTVTPESDDQEPIERSVFFEILPDPRVSLSDEDYRSQYAFLRSVRDKLDATHEVIGQARKLRSKFSETKKSIPDTDEGEALRASIDAADEQLKTHIEALYQTQSKSRQDPLNFPIRLNDKLGALNRGASGFPPTVQDMEVRDLLFSQIDTEIQGIRKVIDESLPAIEEQARAANVPLFGVGETPKSGN